MYNVLEEVSIKKYPVIAENRRLLRSISPSPDLKIMMSGSGPTIFALTPDKKLADTILKEIQTNYTEKCPNASLVKTSY